MFELRIQGTPPKVKLFNVWVELSRHKGLDITRGQMKWNIESPPLPTIQHITQAQGTTHNTRGHS